MNNIDLTQFAMAIFVIIGLVNGINLATEKNWKSFGKFAIAVVAGAVFGYLKWFGIPSIEMGLAIAISSSGVFKIAAAALEHIGPLGKSRVGLEMIDQRVGHLA